MAISVVTFAMTSRALGSAGYGAYGLALTYAAFAGIILDAGLDTHVVTKLAWVHRDPARDPEARRLVSEATLVRLVVGTLATGAAVVICVFLRYPIEVVVGTGILAGTTMANAAAALLSDVFQSILDVRPAVAAAFVSRMVTAGLTVALFLAHALTIWTLLVATVAGTTISVALALSIAYARAFRYTRPSVRLSWFLYRATAPLAAWVILGQIVHRADAIILSVVPLDASFNMTNQQAVGIYVAAYKFFDLSNVLPGYVVATLMPTLASLASERTAFDSYLLRWIPRMALLALASSIGLAIMGGPVLLALSGPDFAPSAPIVVVLSAAIGLAFMTSLLFVAIVALGRRRSLVVLYLAVAIANVFGNFAIDGHWAYWGAAWLTVASQLLLCLGMIWLLKDVVRR